MFVHQLVLRPAWVITAGLLSIGSMVSVDAQVLNQTDAERARLESERIVREQEQQERQRRAAEDKLRQRPSGEVPEILLTPPASTAGPSSCVDVRSLELVGATQLEGQEIASIKNSVIGRCIGLADINTLLARITNLYASRGFITSRAYVPPQDMGSGVLRIVVLEGLVEGIEVKPPGSVSIGTAFPALTGLFNLRDFEQGIDQINRLPSNAAKIDIRPGAGPGGSVVWVNNTPGKRWWGSATLDNSGSEATGLYQAATSLNLDNLMGLNDGIGLSNRQTVGDVADQGMSRSSVVTLSLPYGYWLATLSYTDFVYRTLVHGQVLNFLSEGDGQTSFLKLDRVMFRNQLSKLTTSASLTRRANHNYIAGQLLGTSSRVATVFDLDSNFTHIVAGRVVSADIGYGRGLQWAGATEDPPVLAESAPHANFEKFKFGIGLSGSDRIAAAQVNWSTALTGQHIPRVAHTSEQLAITSPYAVRGYSLGNLSGDSGVYWRNEVGLLIQTNLGATAASLRPYAGFDMGATREKYGIAGGQASGWTVGCNLNAGSVSLQTFYSQSVRRSASLPSPDHHFSARLSVSF